MTKFLLSTVALAALTTASFAADLPSRKAPEAAPSVAAPIFTWTGFYLGLNAGGAWTGSSVRSIVPTNNSLGAANPINANAIADAVAAGAGNTNSSGIMGGVEVGYNYQFSNVVVGIEADLDALSASKTRDTGILTPAAGGGFTVRDIDKVSLNYEGTLRARLGLAANRALFFVTGGAALTQQNFSRIQRWSFADGCPIAVDGLQQCHTGSASPTSVGWVLGAGIEYAINDNWTVKAEYLHSQFGGVKFTTSNVGPAFVGNPQNIVQSLKGTSVDAIRVGINYKFGAPASAVVAKY